MAEEIGQLCRQYVAENASSLDRLPEDEAVTEMASMLRRHAESAGWDALDYHINVEDIARDGLRRHRNQV